MKLVAALRRLGPVRAVVVVLTVVASAGWNAITIAYGAIPVRDGLYNRIGSVAAPDFEFFYAVGTMVRDGRADRVYDPMVLRDRAQELLGTKPPKLVWAYPPPMSMVVRPLGALGARHALLVWLTTLVAGLLALGRLVAGSWRRSWIVLLFPGAGMVLGTGQFTAVLAPCLAAAFLYLESRPALAGVLFGAFVLKPQFAVAAPLYAIGRRRWRFAAASASVAAVACLASLLWFGAPTWAAFARLALNRSTSLRAEAVMFRFVSVFAAVAMLGVSERLALLIHAGSALVIGAMTFDLMVNGRRRSSRAIAFCGATVLFSPYALDYDLILLGLPWLLLVREAREGTAATRQPVWQWLALTWLVPVSYLTALYLQRPIAGPLLWLYVGAVWAADRRGRRRRGSRAAPTSVEADGYLPEGN